MAAKPDIDPQETQEWLDALEAVLENEGVERAHYLLERLVDKGLCRHIGVSNFSIGKLKALIADARLRPEMNQIELHPYLQQPAMLDFCSKNNVHITAYSPLGSPDRPSSSTRRMS